MADAEKKKVAIVDDDASDRKSLTRLIAGAGYQAIAFGSAAEFLSSADSALVSCVVSDLRMPQIDGLGLQRSLGERLPYLSLVFITGEGDIPATVRAMRAGAVDFLQKPIRRLVLLEAVARGIQRSDEMQAAQAASRDLQSAYAKLTAREQQVFSLVSVGLLNKQIAAELGISEKTIKQHRGRVMRKMKADSVADLVMMAESLGVRPYESDFSRAKGRFPSAYECRHVVPAGPTSSRSNVR
jgi:RNA polymerase sigma factor (sigma-70 family)